MTDERACELLEALADYWRSYGDDADSPGQMTVAELVGDLRDSLPHHMEAAHAGAIAILENAVTR